MRLLVALIGLAFSLPAFAQIYRCEDANGVIEYSNKATGNKDKTCRPVDLPVITTIPAPKLPPPKAGATKSGAVSGSVNSNGKDGSARVDESTQRARDSDRKRIIEDELRKEESKLAQQHKDYRNGEPERLGDERNYQKYLDRVQRMKDDIARTQGNIDSLKKELANLK